MAFTLLLPGFVVLFLIDILVFVFLSFPHLIYPVVVLRVAPIHHNFLKLFFIHLIFLVVREIFVLLLLPILNQLVEIVPLLVLLRQLPSLQHDGLTAAMNDLIEMFIENVGDLGVRCEEQVGEFE